MSLTRRTTLRALGATGAALTASGTVLAVGEHDDDERDPDEEDVEDETEPVDPAGAAVRVAHFSPDAPNVDVYVDGDQVLSDLAYEEVSEYLSIDPGTYTVEVTAAGDPETVAFEGDVEIGQAFYTIVATGELEADTFEPLVLVDAGAALARLVHASPDAPAVDVFPAGAEEPLFANLSFGDATDYVPLPVGEYDLEVRPAADEQMADEEAVFTVTVDLAPATAYTGYAIGYLMPEGDQPEFDVAVTVDGPFAEEEPPEEEPEVEPPEDEPDEEPPEDEPDDDYEEEPAEDEPDDDYEDEPADDEKKPADEKPYDDDEDNGY